MRRLVTASERGSTQYNQEAVLVQRPLAYVAAAPEFNGSIQVADWARRTRDYCGAGWVNGTTPTCDLFDADQLHLQGKGDDERSELILETLDRCL